MAVACSTDPLKRISNNGVNKDARTLNYLIKETLEGRDIQLLDLTHLSEFRADAHPAIWLGKKDAVSVWGQDCLHWCLPGVPDTWVDILVQLIYNRLETG
ncbi:PC-Esterase [Corchorus olitorius]|uniref:PC-Esterase n=1 Tax=Corchorus olitorius TaxID=93759 RepID=A0A1R3JBC8_9ROSI|nr:PC-Esterase [Corchorus olitorius]